MKAFFRPQIGPKKPRRQPYSGNSKRTGPKSGERQCLNRENNKKAKYINCSTNRENFASCPQLHFQ